MLRSFIFQLRVDAVYHHLDYLSYSQSCHLLQDYIGLSLNPISIDWKSNPNHLRNYDYQTKSKIQFRNRIVGIIQQKYNKLDFLPIHLSNVTIPCWRGWKIVFWISLLFSFSLFSSLKFFWNILSHDDQIYFCNQNTVNVITLDGPKVITLTEW
jgi:hypothetical protein